MTDNGQLNWVFHGGARHLNKAESVTVLNLNETPAHITFDIYFSDKEPVKGITYTLPAERVMRFPLDKPLGDQSYKIPRGDFAMVIHSDIPVVAKKGFSENI